MLPYVSLYEYMHKQVEHAIQNIDEKYNTYDEYKNIVTSPQLTDQVFIEVMNNYFFDIGLFNTKIKSLKEPEKKLALKLEQLKIRL